MPQRILFITGTDTGVGKTLLTGLLLAHLRRMGAPALALKPFCSGTRADARLLNALQDRDLTLDQVNPFCFPEPLAPFAAARLHRRKITLDDTLARLAPLLHPVGSACHRVTASGEDDTLLIEGVGGLLVPLGENFSVLDLIAGLASASARLQPRAKRTPPRSRLHVLVVARNQLGTLNHTLLTVRALQQALPDAPEHVSIRVVLMDARVPDASSASNPRLLAELLSPVPLFQLPWLGPRCQTPSAIKSHAARLRRSLTRLL